MDQTQDLRVAEQAATVSKCVIVDPKTGPLSVDVKEVDTKGALLDTDVAFQQNEYIDASLELESRHRLSLFAHVVDSGADGLRLRWLHFDPSEEQKLVDFLAGKGLGEVATEEPDDGADEGTGEHVVTRRGTRRIVKPAGESRSQPAVGDDEPKRRTRKVVRPRTTGSDDAVIDFTPISGSQILEDGAKKDAPAKEGSRRTRKIVRPRKHDTVRPFDAEGGGATADEYAPSESTAPEESGARKTITDKGIARAAGAAGSQDESGAHDVVLASTQKYEELKQGTKTHRRTKRHNIVDGDGKLDVGATIRNKAKTVSASELAARHDRVRVLNMKTIKSLIQDAVSEAVQHLGSHLDESEKERLLQEAEDEFNQRLEAFKAENKGLQAQAENLNEQLERAQELLEEERKRKIEADQFTVSDAGLADMEKRFQRIISRATSQGSVDNTMEGELKGIVSKLLDEEREHIADQARKAQGEAIELLEKKVSRLAKSLDDTQNERDKAQRAMKAMAASGGGMALQNVMEAGLDEEDPDKEQKLELLKDIFNQNKELRTALKEQGVEIKSKRRRPVAVAQPEKPEKPEKVDESADEAAEAEAAAPAASTSEAEEPAAAETGDDATETGDDAAADDDMIDPDDMPWEIGMSAKTDVEGDDEDDDGPVKKISASASIADFKMPPLQKKGGPVDESPADVDESPADDAAADDDAGGDDEMMNPDDMPWEVGMSAKTDVEGDDEDDDADAGPVKKISASDAIAKFEPPPLNRD